ASEPPARASPMRAAVRARNADQGSETGRGSFILAFRREHEACASVRSTRRRKFFRKNTIDLQWKMHADYNARLCASLRKAAGARTMENNGNNNGKNNAQSNGTVARSPPPGHVETREKQSPAAERRRAQISITRISAIAHSVAQCT